MATSILECAVFWTVTKKKNEKEKKERKNQRKKEEEKEKRKHIFILKNNIFLIFFNLREIINIKCKGYANFLNFGKNF